MKVKAVEKKVVIIQIELTPEEAASIRKFLGLHVCDKVPSELYYALKTAIEDAERNA